MINLSETLDRLRLLCSGPQLSHDGTHSELQDLKCKVDSVQKKLELLEKQVYSYLKEQRVDRDFVAQCWSQWESVKQDIEASRGLSKRLRLGGSCMHGGDKGSVCSICSSDFGVPRRGPYAALPDGLDVGEFLFTQLDKFLVVNAEGLNQHIIDEGELEEFSRKLSRASDTLFEQDQKIRQLDDETDILKRKLDVMVKRTPGFVSRVDKKKQRMASISSDSDLPNDNEQGADIYMENLSSTLNTFDRSSCLHSTKVCAEKDQTESFFMQHTRKLVINVGPFEFYIFAIEETLSEENEKFIRSGLAPKIGDTKKRILRISSFRTLKKTVQALVNLCLAHKIKNKMGRPTCRVSRLQLVRDDHTCMEIKSSANVFDLPRAAKDSNLRFKGSIALQIESGCASLSEAYTSLCFQYKLWGKRSHESQIRPPDALVPNALALEAFRCYDSGQTVCLDVSSTGESQENVSAIFTTLSLAQKIHQLDLSLNIVRSSSCLQFSLFKSLEVLDISYTVSDMNEAEILFSALAESGVRTLQKLNCSGIPLQRLSPMRTAGSTARARSSCQSQAVGVPLISDLRRGPCFALSRVIQVNDKLQSLSLEHCFQASKDFLDSPIEDKITEDCAMDFSALVDAVIKSHCFNFASLKGGFFCGPHMLFKISQLLLHEQLAILDFSFCQTLSNGASHGISECCDGNSNIQMLSLRGSDLLGGTGFDAFFSRLETNSTSHLRFLNLVKLDLSNCVIPASKAEKLFDAMYANTTIEELNLNDNPKLFDGPQFVASCSMSSFHEMLRNNGTLKILRLKNVGILRWKVFLEHLSDALDSHTSRSSLFALESGVEISEEKLTDECDYIMLDDVMGFLRNFNSRVTHLRIWHPLYFVKDIACVSAIEGYPMSFKNFIEQYSQEADCILYAWMLSNQSGTVIDLRMGNGC